jgi:Arc/MetJ family transcription regulator
MRTNIEIDDKLLHRAMEASGTTTKRAAVEAALRLTVQMKKQEAIKELFGKVQWDGDLNEMRQSRVLEWEEERAGDQQEKTASNIESLPPTSTVI